MSFSFISRQGLRKSGLFLLGWTILFTFLFVAAAHQQGHFSEASTIIEARANFEKDKAIVIPTEAIIEVNGKDVVYIIDQKKSTVAMRQVDAEYSQSDYSVIREGLEKDELIALTSLDKLKPGTKVEILEKQQI